MRRQKIDKIASVDLSNSANVTVPIFEKLNINYGFVGKQDPSIRANLVNQVHGTKIVEAGPGKTAFALDSRIEADGLYTCTELKKVCVVTADCLPILICDKESKMIMAVHGGWRGLTAGILGNAVDKYKEKGINPDQILIAFGPAISGEKYEVGPEVIAAVKENGLNLTDSQISAAVSPGEANKSFLSLNKVAKYSLINRGAKIDNIHTVDSCTYSNEDLWHGYRRDGKRSGRNYSWIEIRSKN